MKPSRAALRAKRATVERALKASPLAEAKYVRALKRILGEVSRVYAREMERHMPGPQVRDARHGPHGTLDELDPKIIRYVRSETGRAFDEMASAVDKKSAQAAKSLFRVTPRGMSTNVEIQRFRDQNIALVENAARDYAASVRAIFSDPANFGMRVEEVAKELRGRDKIAAELEGRDAVSQSRAELIARDQTLKLNSQLNTTRQQNAGVTRFVWSTTGDTRVRPDHAKLNGQTYSYVDPPVTNERTGERNLPGMDIQCRCLPLPIVDELEGI